MKTDKNGNRRCYQGLILFIILSLMASFGCSATPEYQKPSSEKFIFSWKTKAFNDYLDSAKEYVRKNRIMMNPHRQNEEVEVNLPFELAPDPNLCPAYTKPEKGILLIHGLGDSPYSMRDLANEYSKSCFLVRAILLPGHGTRPGDSLTMTAEEWYQTSAFALESLKKDVNEVYLGGFSTGANIATLLAWQDSSIKGLALFSPAFALNWEHAGLLSFVDIFIDWLNENPIEDYTKYTAFSVNSLQQFYITSAKLQNVIDKGGKLNIPVFIALSENDSVVNVQYINQVFQENLIFSGNRMMLFTGHESDPNFKNSSRTVLRKGYLPDQQIYSISHMAITTRLDNPHYGKNGDYRNCIMTEFDKDYKRCHNTDKDLLWYGSWGDKSEGKTFSRLMYNPYFDEMVAMSIKTILNPKLSLSINQNSK